MNNLREFAASSNGDRWFLGRDEENGLAYVVHKAGDPSGGTITHLELGDFLNRGPLHPQHEALLRLIGTLARPPEAFPTRESWAIYRHESKGRLEYLGAITAKGGEDALVQATKLLPEEDPENLIAKLRTGEPEPGGV